jgi:hypothetical protein
MRSYLTVRILPALAALLATLTGLLGLLARPLLAALLAALLATLARLLRLLARPLVRVLRIRVVHGERSSIRLVREGKRLGAGDGSCFAGTMMPVTVENRSARRLVAAVAAGVR